MDINSVQPQNENLIEITTPLQAKRGNRQFFDREAYVSYITYANGYVRREVNATYKSNYDGSVVKCQDQFVINKRKAVKHTYGTFNGEEQSYKAYSIIKEHCPQKRMDIIDRISSNYKGYKGRFSNHNVYTLEMK